MPLVASTLSFECDETSRDSLSVVGSTSNPIIYQANVTNIRASLFDGEPSATTFVSDISNITAVRLIIRKNHPQGTVLIDKTGARDGTTTYTTWGNGTKQHFLFTLSAIETNQAVPSDGTLDIYAVIEVTTASGPVVVGFFNGSIDFDGITGVDNPVLPGTGAQHANYLYAGPTSGSPALPTFRALVSADVAGLGLGGGTGSVTSVAFSAPNIFTVTGSPITVSGTINLALATQSANSIFAGPSSGSAATPAFRSLVAGDIPSLSSVYQPLDSDLTAIAALTTDSFGRTVLTKTDAASIRSYIGAGTSSFSGLFTGLDFTSSNLASLATRNFSDLQVIPTSLTIAYQTFSNADVTLSSGSRIVAQTGTLSAIRTVTLPGAAAAGPGSVIIIYDASRTTNFRANKYVRAQRSGSDTINGTTVDYIPNSANSSGALWLISDGVSNWQHIDAINRDSYTELLTTFEGVQVLDSGGNSVSGLDITGLYGQQLTIGSAIVDAIGLTDVRAQHFPDADGTFALTTNSSGVVDVTHGGTGLTSLGTGVGTFLGTPSSANLRAALTDENGTGVALFDGATNPTFTGATIGSGTLTLSGNQSAVAWTTNGIRIKGISGTLTDTSSSGTVAAAYTNKLGGNTIAASSATTFTDYISSYFSEPVAGTNITLTNKWGLGADSLYIGTSNPVKITSAGLLTVTNASSAFNGTVGATTPTTGAFTTLTNTGAATNSKSGAASTPALTLSGVPFAGTGTTSFPLVYINDANATASTTLNTAGTYFGVNGDGTQDLMNLLKDGTSQFLVSSAGVTTTVGTINGGNHVFSAAGSIIGMTGRSNIASAVNGNLRLANSAQSDFTLLQFGGTSNSFNGIGRDAVNGFTLQSAAGTATWNDGSTANSGTVANRYLFGIAAPTLTATGTSVTDTVASTVYIGGAPTASTNTTITTPYALYVAAGVTKLAGIVILTTGYTVATLPSTAATGMVQGARAYVTDALAPTFLGALTGGGAIVSPVFYNGSAWVAD